MNKSAASVLALAITSTLAFAAKDADLKPTLATPGKIILETHFKSDKLEAPWAVAKGDWVVQDGAVVGKEKESDHHNAVLLLKLPARDSIIRFSYKLDGIHKFELSYNDAKGHLFRAMVEPTSVVLTKDRDKKEATSTRETLAKTSANLPAGEWHTMLVEVKGEQVNVQSDDGSKVELKDPLIAADKTGFRFVLKGASLMLDDVRVWEVAP